MQSFQIHLELFLVFPLAVIFYHFGLDRVGWAVPEEYSSADGITGLATGLNGLTEVIRSLVVVKFCIFYEIVSILECIAYQALEGMFPLLNRLLIGRGRMPKYQNYNLFKIHWAKKWS